MDAKERLRLYLEQRRDAGETELVLDSMSVEEVMRMLGAGGAGRGTPGAAAATARAVPAFDRPAPADRPAVAAPAASEPPGDWRQALRALDSRPSGEGKGEAAPSPPPVPRAPLPRTDSQRAPSPAAAAARPLPPEAPPGSEGDRPDAPVSSSRPMTAPAEGSPPQEASHATIPLEQVPTGLVVGSPAHELFGGPQSPWQTLDDIAAAAAHCERCTLFRTAKQAVPGQGNPEADFVCVGEAPGANEDEQGVPFVGQAGQLLTKILAAINLSRDDVFICNVLKHRPPGNRNPTPDEVTACSPFLVRQIELLNPKVIVALGTFAAQTLLQTKEPIGKLRGKIHRYYGVPLIVTYHPAALLRNPSWKRPTWEDVQLARRLFDRARSA
ncbi:MAG TPA: uracil-DNA glycosylase [Gemmatimonadaceae bacterium]|nr:uracil-DNA glycosylase [Gemmatimonadaceae bacterium]HPV74142.1 uracil-DNA glycosylase [Gemmatimonadaceae bacterium]